MHILGTRRSALYAVAVAVLLTAMALPAGSAASSAASGTQLKVALVAPSATNDLAFTQSMYSALKSLQAKYGFKLSVSENEFVVANAADIIRTYASEGYNLIIAHGSQYGGTIQQLAPQFPKVSFAWGTASSTFGLKNVYAYSAASNQGGYVEGYLAGLISKSKVVGEIGPIATGDAQLYIDGFKAGVLAAAPSATVHVSYTGSFSDPSLMSKQATEYLAEKADVLTGSSQSVVGAISVAKANNIAWFGTQWTQASLAPKQVVASQVYNWMPVLTSILNGIKAGKLGGQSYSITLKNGGESIQYNPGYPLSSAIKAAAAKKVAAIEANSIVLPT